jgi:hypothetical protein
MIGVKDMICKNCGREIDSNMLFCKYCGMNLKETPKEKKNFKNKIFKNKKILIGAISGIVALIIVVILFAIRSNTPTISINDLYNAFDNTLNLKSYMLSISSDSWDKINSTNEKIYVERETEMGTIEYDEVAAFHEGGAYHIAGIEVLEDDKFVFDNEDDNYYYYYEGSNVYTSVIEYDGLVTKLLEKLKTYKFEKKNNEYILVLEQDEELSSILNVIMPESMNRAYPSIQIAIKDGYINTIKIPDAKYFDEDTISYNETSEGAQSYIIINLDSYNKVEIELPDKIKTSLARNYYNFIIYGDGPFESDDKYYAINKNSRKIYKEKTNICPNGESKISFYLGSDNGVYKPYFWILNDCNGKGKYKELYIKNTSKEFNPLSNHKDDIYNLYDKKTNELIGKFTYDGNNTITIFDSQNYSGNYVKDN